MEDSRQERHSRSSSTRNAYNYPVVLAAAAAAATSTADDGGGSAVVVGSYDKHAKVIVVGGSGRVGGSTVRALRQLAGPDLQLAVGGRSERNFVKSVEACIILLYHIIHVYIYIAVLYF